MGIKFNSTILRNALQRGGIFPQKSPEALALFKFSLSCNPFKLSLCEAESKNNICNLANVMVINEGSFYSGDFVQKLVQRFTNASDRKNLQAVYGLYPESVIHLGKYQNEFGSFLAADKIKKLAPLHHKEPKIVDELLAFNDCNNFITNELVDECAKDFEKTMAILERFTARKYKLTLNIDENTGTVIKLIKNKDINSVVRNYQEFETKFMDKITNEGKFLLGYTDNMVNVKSYYWWAHPMKYLELIQILDEKTIEKLLKEYDFQAVVAQYVNVLKDLNYSDLKLAQKLINAKKITGSELTEHEKLCVFSILNLYKKSNIPMNNLKKMINNNQIDIQQVNMDIFKATMKTLGKDYSNLMKLDKFIEKNPKYSFLKFNKTEHFEYLYKKELDNIINNPYFDLMPEYGVIDEKALIARLNKVEQLEKIFPKEIQKLKETAGNSFYNIKWENFENINSESLNEMNNGFKFLLTVNCYKAGRMNFDYGKKMIKIKNEISSEITSGKNFDDILHSICEKYRAHSKYNETGQSRKYENFYTVYHENVYSEYYAKLKSIIGKQQSPNEKFALTKITDLYMIHPNSNNIDKNLDFARQSFKKILPLLEKTKTGNKLTKFELEKVNEQIAEIMYILSHTCPYYRGSNGISNIFIRSLYQSLGVDLPALKNGVSLDLEAFCAPTLDSYKKNWKTFFVSDIK